MGKLLVTFFLLALICIQTVNYAKKSEDDIPASEDDGVVVEDEVEVDSDGFTEE